MRDIDVITEKLHVLAVLEDGYFKDAGKVRFLLDEYFSLKPSKEAVRKHLERCFDQELVTRERRGRSYHYRISVKGRERLRRIRAKRQKQWEESQRRFAESRESESPQSEPEKIVKVSLFDRVVEVATSIRLCDVVLRLSDDQKILNWAGLVKVRWQFELQKLIPVLPMPTLVAAYSTLFNNAIPTAQQETIPWTDVLTMRERRDEEEYVFYCFDQERKEKERLIKLYNEEKSKRQELEKENEHLKLDRQPDVSGVFKLGRKIGKHETKMEQILSQQKLISSSLQDRLLGKQKAEEAVHAIHLRRCINWRWWDLLPSSRSSTDH